jgi:hypothetical protein
VPQIFHRSTNTLARLSIFGALFLVAGVLWGLATFNRSAYMTQQRVARAQPVQFSHKHHVGELGIDCRYCHTTVETAARATVPPTETCMSCHSQIWLQSPFLEPVRASFRTDRSIPWVKVHDLPDYVYFNHGVHIQKGIGCVSCHGRVDQMNQVWRESSLQMEWCLECHRDPARQIRPRERLFDLGWEPPADQPNLGAELVRLYDVHARTDCSTCHR